MINWIKIYKYNSIFIIELAKYKYILTNIKKYLNFLNLINSNKFVITIIFVIIFFILYF